MRPVRCALNHFGHDTLGERFWPYLFTQAAHISNRLPTYAHKPPVSPIEKVTGKPPTLKMFKNRVPLCDIWVRINNPEDQISKLSARNVKAKYLCWDERRGGDLVYIQELNRTATAYHSTPLPRNCTIVGEPVKLRSRLERDGDVRTAVNTPDPMDNLPGMPGRPTVRRGEAPGLEAMRRRRAREQAAAPNDLVNIDVHHDAPPPPPPLPAAAIAHALVTGVASNGDAIAVRGSSEGELFAMSPTIGPIRIPKDYWDAVNDPVYGEQWKAACIEEFNGKYVINQSWSFVDLPAGQRAMKSKWVFSIEYNEDGSVKRFKPRIVGCGYSQIPGVHFFETFACTPNADCVRTFFAYVTQEDLEVIEADVVKAFTHAPLEEELYMQAPQGFEQGDKVCRMHKCVEGTKQGANGFMKLNANTMKELGFERNLIEPNVFIRNLAGVFLLCLIYVDNILVAFARESSKAKKQAMDFLKAYGQKINLQVRGPPKKFLGIEIARDYANGTTMLTQTKYIEDAYKKYCTKSMRDYVVPVHHADIEKFRKLKPAETEAEKAAASSKCYMELMGVLIWCCLTHPDCQYFVSSLCQLSHGWTAEAYEFGLGVLCFLYATRASGLLYQRLPRLELSCWFDSSWGAEPRPMAGYVIFLNGVPVAWSARKLKIVPLSSCEAETAAGCNASKALLFVRSLLNFMGAVVPVPIGHCDVHRQ